MALRESSWFCATARGGSNNSDTRNFDSLSRMCKQSRPRRRPRAPVELGPYYILSIRFDSAIYYTR